MIFILGVIFFTSPEWLSAILNWHFEISDLSEWAREWGSKIGEAAIIGVLVAYFLDRLLVESLTSLTEAHEQKIENDIESLRVTQAEMLGTSIASIKREVFFGTIGYGIESDVFSLFRKTIVECPVYRDPMRMRITMTLEVHRQGAEDIEVLRCDWYEEYAISGLHSPVTDYKFEISQSTDDLPFMEEKAGITNITIDGVTIQGSRDSPFIGEKSGGYSTYSHTLKIPHGKAIKVESYSTAYKTLTDSDSFEMVMPTKNLEVEVVVIGCKLKVRAHIMAESGWDTGGRHGLNGNTFHWIPKNAMLPYQRVAIQWAPEPKA